MDQLRVMHNRVASTKVGVLLSKAVEAMRTECQDSQKRVVLQGLDIHPSLHLIEILMPHSARRVPCAALLLSQNGEREPRLVKNLDKTARDPLIAWVESRRAANP